MGPDEGDGDASLSPPKPVALADSAVKKQGGAGKPVGAWNYNIIECVAVAWAGLAASELRTTDMEGLYGRIQDY